MNFYYPVVCQKYNLRNSKPSSKYLRAGNVLNGAIFYKRFFIIFILQAFNKDVIIERWINHLLKNFMLELPYGFSETDNHKA